MKARRVALLMLLALLLSCSERTPTAPAPDVTAAVAATFVGPSGLVQVSAGWRFACGLKADGTVVCWGSTGFVPPPPEGTFTHVAADGPCALTQGGSVLCWGENYSGRAAAPSGRFTEIDGGGNYACGVRQNGTLACWGRNLEGQSSPPAGKFAQVSAGGALTCALAEDASLHCWGLEFYGAPAPTGQFAQVDVGGEHACAVRLDGSLLCWGRNLDGESSPPAGEFTQVAVGRHHSCALQPDGDVTCWGLDDEGQATPPTGTFTQVSAEDSYACGLRSDGVAVCWGDIGTEEYPPVPLPRYSLTGSGKVTDDEGSQIRFSLQVRVLPRYGSAPEGSVTFRSDDGSEFRSTRLHELTSGAFSLTLWGTGWYQGEELDFILSAVDGESATAGGVVDGFRIELWADEFNDLVYDSGGDPPPSGVKPLEQGSIRSRLK